MRAKGNNYLGMLYSKVRISPRTMPFANASDRFKEFPELHKGYGTYQVSSPRYSDIPCVPFVYTTKHFSIDRMQLLDASVLFGTMAISSR
jgi:hypothetical protein